MSSDRIAAAKAVIEADEAEKASGRKPDITDASVNLCLEHGPDLAALCLEQHDALEACQELGGAAAKEVGRLTVANAKLEGQVERLEAALRACVEEFKHLGHALGEMTPIEMVDTWNLVEAALAGSAPGATPTFADVVLVLDKWLENHSVSECVNCHRVYAYRKYVSCEFCKCAMMPIVAKEILSAALSALLKENHG